MWGLREFTDSRGTFIFAHIQTSLTVVKIIPASRVYMKEASLPWIVCVTLVCFSENWSSTLLYIKLLGSPLLNSAVKNMWTGGFRVAGGIHNSLPAKKGRVEGEKENTVQGGMSYALQRKAFCLLHWYVWWEVGTISSLVEWRWNCVCIVWELEDSVFIILNYSACKYAKAGNICFTVVSYFDVSITDFSDLHHNNAL